MIKIQFDVYIKSFSLDATGQVMAPSSLKKVQKNLLDV